MGCFLFISNCVTPCNPLFELEWENAFCTRRWSCAPVLVTNKVCGWTVVDEGRIRMRLIFALPLAAAVVLAGCDKKADTPKTMEQAAEQAKQMARPEPGKYRSSVKMLEFDIPGLPPAQAEQMKKSMGGTTSQSHEFCLTAKDVEQGYEEMVKKSAEGNCTFEKFETTTNTIDAKMTCNMSETSKAEIAMNGNITPTKSVMVMEINNNVSQVPGGKIHTKMEVTNERIGDCS